MRSRILAEKIFRIAVESVQPEKVLPEYLKMSGGSLFTGEAKVNRLDIENIYVIGAGKASGAMALAAEKILGPMIASGHVVVKYGHSMPLSRIEISEAGHPVPDHNGFSATKKIVRIAEKAGAKDLVICLISGGGSALMADCPEGVTPDEMAEMNNLLVRCGADINEINIVRKHVSGVKGGRLAAIAWPAMLVNLLLSDVPGDSPSVIASGPAYPDPSTYSQAMKVLLRYGILGGMPPAVRNHLEAGVRGLIPETPKPGDSVFGRVSNIIIGSNRIALDAAATACMNEGLRIAGTDYDLQGDASLAAERIVSDALKLKRDKKASKPAVLLYGGETTVTVRGKGTGGRNQHLALLCADKLNSQTGITVLCAGTDGTDGPTDAAGAVVDSNTVADAIAMNADPREYISDFDSYSFFRRFGGHILTGPTMTNVMDIVIVVVE